MVIVEVSETTQAHMLLVAVAYFGARSQFQCTHSCFATRDAALYLNTAHRLTERWMLTAFGV